MRDLPEAGAAEVFRLPYGPLLRKGASENRLEESQESL